MTLKSTLLNELASFLQENLNDKYFVCIYGSYANNNANFDSDLDLFIAIESKNQEFFDNLKNFIITLHKNNNLQLDNEVPYENKLLVSYEEARSAVNLQGLKVEKDHIIVPKIEKNSSFLASSEVKKRLIFNALTSPHIFLGNDKESYDLLKKTAETNLGLLAFELSGYQKETEKLIEVLLVSKDGNEGEMYLGYKKYDSIIDYLKNILNPMQNMKSEEITDNLILLREKINQ